MLPGAFLDKVTADTDFTDESVVKYDVSVVKVLLEVLVIYKCSPIDCDVNTSVLFLDPVSYEVLFS